MITFSGALDQIMRLSEDDVAQKLAVHEVVCAERWKQAEARLKRIELVLIAIVFLLLLGEGTVLEVVKRLVAK
jgi:hypothetical protein